MYSFDLNPIFEYSKKCLYCFKTPIDQLVEPHIFISRTSMICFRVKNNTNSLCLNHNIQGIYLNWIKSNKLC